MTTSRNARRALLLLAGAALAASSASSGAGPPAAPAIKPGDRASEGKGAVRQLPPPAERWALVAGIGRYGAKSDLSELHGDLDATSFATTLEEHAGFRNDHIVLLAGQDTRNCRPLLPGAIKAGAAASPVLLTPASSQPPARPLAGGRGLASSPCEPTRQHLVNELRQITSKMTKDGLFVFFFSGHGQRVAGESVLFPSDVVYRPALDDAARELDLKHQGLSGRDFADVMNTDHARQVFIFLDACRGQLTTERAAPESSGSAEFSKGFDLKSLGVAVDAAMTFYSSGQGSASYEDGEGRSYFTSELTQAFDGRRDAYGPGNVLTLAGLVKSVKDNVQSRVELDKGVAQKPEFHFEGLVPELLVLAGREVPSGAHPELLSGSAVLMTPDATRVYVANIRGVLNVFDTATGQPQQIIDLRPGAPGRMVMAARRNRIYVTDPASRTVVVIDAASQRVLWRLPTGVYPEDLALTPDETKLYVANQQPAPVGSISVFDLGESDKLRTSITGVNCPEGLAMAPDGALMYVESQCGFADDPLFVVDTKVDRVDHSIPGFAVGTTALGMLPNGEKLYIGTGEPERTRVLITATGDVKALGRPGDPKAYARYFAATPDGRYVLGVGGSRYLLVINTITDEVVRVKDLGSPGAGIVIGTAPGTTRAACYVWLPEENRLFFTALDGILSADSEH